MDTIIIRDDGTICESHLIPSNLVQVM